MMHVGVTVFKSFNKHYNGNYTITNRAPFMLYGNVARRIEPHHKDNLKAAIALILGEGVCRSVANDKDCRYWQFMTADGLGTDRLIALNTTISAQQDIDAQLIRETKDMVIEHPLPVVFFGIVEGLKMFFWESTQIGFVVYPAWLTHIYENNIFKSCIRLIISVITGIVVIGFTVWSIRSKQSDKLLLVLMAWVFIFLLTWITVLPRYVFPIVPVYFLMAACWLNQLSVKAGKT